MRLPQLSVLLLNFIALLVATTQVFAQVPQGQILGVITDASGSVIPGAIVTIENESTGVKRSVESNESGDYVFSYLNSGTYRLSVERSGFKNGVYPGIEVQVGEKKRMNARLEIGEVTSTVEITGGAALVQTDSATINSIVSRREVIEMPLNGREFSQLATLMPGVRAVGTTGGALITQFATAVQVGGTSSGKNGYTIDGADNTFNIWSGPAMNPSIDSIQEFRVDRSQFTAEYGRGGAQMQLVSKNGTNQFHGAAWEFLRNYKLNAGNYVTHLQDTTKRNQYGANLGGPIIQNKAFFFFNWEGQRERSSVQPLGTVFTDRMRRGDFSEFAAPIVDPVTRQPFVGNIIPIDRLNAVSLDYMNAMMGRPNQPGASGGLINNYVNFVTTSRDWDQFIGRVDYNLTAKDTIFFRINAQPRNGINAPLTATSINSNEDMKFYNTGLGWNRTWSPTITTETRLTYHGERLLLGNQPPATLPTNRIRGFGPDSLQPPPTRLPQVTISPSYGFYQWNFPWDGAEHAYELLQNASFFKGKHLIKAGFTGRLQKVNRKEFGERALNLSFTGAYTGLGAADYMLGLPFSVSESLPPTNRIQQYGDYSAFIQDDWKVTPNLTLNLGLRYELATLPSEEYDRWTSFSPGLRKAVVAGDRIQTEFAVEPLLNAYQPFLIPGSQTSLPEHTLAYGDHNNFAPRFGFAWRPFSDNKTVVRGGYGVFYVLGDGNLDFNNAGSAPPYGGSVSTVNTTPIPSFTINSPFGSGTAPPPPLTASHRHPEMRQGYLQQITLGIQRELPWDVVGEINFQDQNSLKLESSWNINQPAPGGMGPLQSLRPFPEFGANLPGNFHDGHSRYNAVEFVIRKTSTHYTFQWSHTWAKNLGRIGVVDVYNRDLFSGPIDYVPHLDKLNFVLDLPFGKGRKFMGKGGVTDAVLGGWTVSGLGTLYQSGPPLTITWTGIDPSNTGTFTNRANRIADGRVDNPTVDQWFDPSAFVAPTPGGFGNAGTGTVFGPSSFGYDLGIYKSFSIRETTKLQFRTEMFNAFNHPNLAMPGTAANVAGFGSITTKSQSPRVIQFALRLTF